MICKHIFLITFLKIKKNNKKHGHDLALSDGVVEYANCVSTELIFFAHS